MIFFSDHQTTDSQCEITNTQSNLYWISYKQEMELKQKSRFHLN